MRCDKCNTIIEDYYYYCPECGKRLTHKGDNSFKNFNESIYKKDIDEMKKYGIYNPKIHVPTIIIGIIFIIFGIVFVTNVISTMGIVVGIIVFFVGLLLIFQSKKHGTNSIFKKQAKKIKKGMNINEVRAIMGFIEPEQEGFNRMKEYSIYYTTNKKHKKNADYEAVCVTFDSDAKVIDISIGYRRTTTYTY